MRPRYFSTTYLGLSIPWVVSKCRISLKKTLLLMGGLDNPSADPEVSASAISLMEYMIPQYFSSMMTMDNIQALLDFVLRALTVLDIMPRRSSASFWVRAVYILSPSEINCPCRPRSYEDMSYQTQMPISSALLSRVTVRWSAKSSCTKLLEGQVAASLTSRASY